MKKRMEIIIRVNNEAGSEPFYQKSQALGTLAAQAFRGEQERHRAQMTGLENIAETNLKVTDILDFIKKQTAHQRGSQGWKKRVGSNNKLFGELLIDEIEQGLEAFKKNICDGFLDETSKDGKLQRQEVYLLLIRQLIRQMVVKYEYEVSLAEEKVKS